MVVNYILVNSFREWWIGLKSSKAKKLSITSWADGEPSGDGEYLHLFSEKNYKLNDIKGYVSAADWSIPFSPICQKTILPSPNPPSPNPPSSEPSSPTPPSSMLPSSSIPMPPSSFMPPSDSWSSFSDNGSFWGGSSYSGFSGNESWTLEPHWKVLSDHPNAFLKLNREFLPIAPSAHGGDLNNFPLISPPLHQYIMTTKY